MINPIDNLDEDIKGFGNRLLELRRVLNLTQKELASKCGVSNTLISYLEKGEVKIPVYLLNLANILKVNVHYLLTGKGKLFLEEKDEENIKFEITKARDQLSLILNQIKENERLIEIIAELLKNENLLKEIHSKVKDIKLTKKEKSI